MVLVTLCICFNLLSHTLGKPSLLRGQVQPAQPLHGGPRRARARGGESGGRGVREVILMPLLARISAVAPPVSVCVPCRV